MIRWGVISTAKIGREQVIPAIQASRNGRVVAIASRDAAKGAETAKALGIPGSYGSYEDLLADPTIDAIYNPLPNDGHAPWSIAALKAGKHVLVEKPIALNADETRTLIAAAEASEKNLAEAFMYRYHPQHARARELVAEGAIGALRMVISEFSFSMSPAATENVRLKPELGGGGLLDVGCYCVNSARMAVGREPIAVSGMATNGDSGVDVGFVGLMRFPDGVLGQFACGIRSYGRQHYTLVGDRGRLTVDLAFRPDQGVPSITLMRADKTETIAVPASPQYVLMAEDFADAILEKRATRFPLSDGLQNMRVLDALAQSAREGREVAL
jgi:predicted dehydrogenase